MLKKVILLVVVMLLTVSAAQAQFPLPIPGLNFQAQDLDAALANVIALNGGPNAPIVSNQLLSWNNVQNLGPMMTSAFGHQSSTGSISENANAHGNSAAMLIGQGVLTGGAQVQHIGNAIAPVMQGQGQGLVGGSGIQKAGGFGIGNANQVAVIHNDQTAGNMIGVVSETSDILSMQNQMYTGLPVSAGLVESSMAISTNQQQIMSAY